MSVAVDGGSGTLKWVPPTVTCLEQPKRHPISPMTRRLKVLQLGTDGVAVSAAMVLSYLLPLRVGDDVQRKDSLLFLLACLPLWVVAFSHYRLYSARAVASRMEESSRLLRAVVLATICTTVISYTIQFDLSRSVVFGTAALTFLLCLVEREAVRRAFCRMRASGRLRRRAVIIGGNEEAMSFAWMFRTMPNLGYEAVGFCSDDEGSHAVLPWLGRLDDAPERIAEAGASTAVIATTSLRAVEANRLVRRLHDAGIHVELSAGLCDIPAERLSVRDLGRHAVFYLEPTVHGGWRAAAKRAFDVSISVATLLLLGPALAVAAVLVKLTSSGPVLFHQERVGQGGATFRVHKLRTMIDGADDLVAGLTGRNEADGPLFKLRDDPRVTRVGMVLRRLSIDELPQLWNVLKGEMSLVGPRPALVRELPGWTPELHNRLRVKPGLTGMWQVSGRSNASFDDYVRHDLFYVDNWTLLRDLVILGKTVPTIILRRGAY